MVKKMAQQNKYIQTVCELTDEPNSHRAVAKYVARFRNQGQSLESLAKALDIFSIIEEELAFDGGVFELGSKLIIKINSGSHPTRRRFTLAHELGHLIISSKEAKSARRCLTSNPLEAACDAVAAELLMPFDEVVGSLDKDASIDSFLAFVNHFNVSLHAAAVRIKELKIWKESIGFWKLNPSLDELWLVGKRYWNNKAVRVSLFEDGFASANFVQAELMYGDARGIHPIYVQTRKLGKNYVLALVRV